MSAAGALANHATIQAVLDRTSIPPGGSATVALVYKIDPGWHTYWMNPGDAGAAPKVKWNLPPGVTISDLQFPIPERKTSDGLTTFIYENEVALLATITVPADQKSDFDLTGKIKSVVCSDECLFEEQDVAIRIQVGNGQPNEEQRFSQWRAALPRHSAKPRTIAAQFKTDGKAGSLNVPLQPGQTVIDLLPPKTRLMKFDAPSATSQTQTELSVGFSVLSDLPAQWAGSGLLVTRDSTGQTSAEEIQFTFTKP